MSFYSTGSQILILPSDGSSEYFPNNITSKFTIKLPEILTLNDSFEVALLEFIYPNSVRNIPNKTFIRIKAKNENETIPLIKSTLDPGIYTEEKLLEKIKFHLEKLNLDIIKQNFISSLKKKYRSSTLNIVSVEKPSFDKNVLTNKIELKCGKISLNRDNQLYEFDLYLEFGEYLYRILGFRGISQSCEKLEADNIIDIFGQIHIIYIYSDIVSPIIVGSERVPLLQMFTLDHPNRANLEPGSQNRITFQSPIYVPISRKTFETINIEVRDDSGELIQFETGKTLATLHIRPISK